MPAADKKPQTLYDKVFEDHIVNEQDDGTILLYIGTHILVRLLQISKKLTPSLQTDTLFTKLRHR
jgi:homoaconitase/3-isopropylmalate dehydratase large subunit